MTYGRSFYDTSYFLGIGQKRGQFSLVELHYKYIDRASFLLSQLTLEEKSQHLVVAEIGAGAAPFARILQKLQRLGEFTRIRTISIDFSVAGIHLISENMRPCFIQSDAYNIAIRSESVNGIVAWDLLEHMEKPDQALYEMSRILVTGGFLHIVDQIRTLTQEELLSSAISVIKATFGLQKSVSSFSEIHWTC